VAAGRAERREAEGHRLPGRDGGAGRDRPRLQGDPARGEFVDTPLEPLVTATVHPSSILRAQDDGTRHSEMEAFVRDLRTVATAIGT
jgi:hypothetical protein